MLKKVLVLGSNSFAGAAFVDWCLSNSCRVLGISRSHQPHEGLLYYSGNQNLSNFQFLQADLNKDFNKTLNAIDSFQPEYIVDFAGQGMVAPSWDKPEQWYQTNIVSKAKLHNELRALGSLKKYLRTSTPEVYGSTATKITEEHCYKPSTPYAVSHAAIDMSLQCFVKQHNFPAVFTRSANFYGPYQQLYRIIPRAIMYSRLGKKLQLHGGGTSVRSFVHVEDFCKASAKVLFEGEPGEVYHIASDEYVSIRELVELIATETKVDFGSLAEVGEDRPGKDQAYLLSCDKIKEQFSWSAEISLREGITQCINWVDKYLNDFKDLEHEYIHKE